jgi:flagellar assembly protein FliH
MSSSSRPALESKHEPAVEAFPYAEAGSPAASARGPDLLSGVASGSSQEVARQRERAVYQEGQRDGEERARAFYDEQIDHLRDSVRDALAEFHEQRAAYYQRVEAEVVQLALSIARKVLHRESQVDPLLLAAMVRVALDKIEQGTEVQLRVHPQHVAEWLDYFHRQTGGREVPEIIEDATLPPERCVLATSLGTTSLGIDVQLKEIEKGLLDLLAQRPAEKP